MWSPQHSRPSLDARLRGNDTVQIPNLNDAAGRSRKPDPCVRAPPWTSRRQLTSHALEERDHVFNGNSVGSHQRLGDRI